MKLSRRQLISASGGITVTLPLLASMSSRAESAAPPPKRFIAMYHPNGVYTPKWFPTGGASETDFTLGEIHQPLVPYQAHLLVTSGIDMKVAVVGPGEQHQRGIGAWLTGAKISSGVFVGNDGTKAGYAEGKSIDQAMVPLISSGTRIPSLQLGVHSLIPNVAGCVSYAGANQPLLPQNDPRLTFRTLFMDAGSSSTELDKLRQQRKSVLDGVRDQLALFRARTSRDDASRIDQHLTLVRELEVRVTAMPPGACGVPPEPDEMKVELEANFETIANLQIDLLLLAMRCDLTRIATIMFSDALNHMAMPHLHISTDIHNLTHFADADAARAQVAKRDTWQSTVFAKIVSGMKDIVEHDGSHALSRSLLFWGTDVSRGNVHAHDDMPFVLAGGGTGFRMGRYVRFAKVSHNDLLVSILNGFGSTVTTFGNAEFCTGPLSGLI